MSMEDSLRDVIVTSIGINDTAVIISFMEVRDQSETAGLEKTIGINRDSIEELVEELLDTADEIIESGLLAIRNPAKTIRPKRKRVPLSEIEETEAAKEPVDHDDDDEDE